MPKCTIDGREVEFSPGENLIEVAKRVGVEIPFFCYHPGLSVVAQCRMCAVEIEKMPKLQTACSTPAGDGMVVKTQSERAKQNQKSIMEFLLINHPLDCPVCDKSGECDLQDNSYKFGDPYSRYTEERRTYLDLDMGPVIKKNMNRCIHCMRCIRFGAEVAGIREMVAVQRGNNTEITTIDGRPLETDYAGNYADVCPTGSLTLKDFRFKKRAWYLKKTPTVCEGCSRGCNIELHQEAGRIYRTLPRENLEINRYWICDEGRFNYHYVNDPSRVVEPSVQDGAGMRTTDWATALDVARATLSGRKVLVLVGSDITQEEATLLREVVPTALSGSIEFRHFGTQGVTSVSADADEDSLLKRKSKTSNLHGIEKLGWTAYSGSTQGFDAVLMVRGGRAQLPDLHGLPTVGMGVFGQDDAATLQCVLPGLSFAEKDGTIVNFQGREQKLKRAISPVGQSKAISEIWMLWVNSRKGQSAGLNAGGAA